MVRIKGRVIKLERSGPEIEITIVVPICRLTRYSDETLNRIREEYGEEKVEEILREQEEKMRQYRAKLNLHLGDIWIEQEGCGDVGEV